MANEVVKSPSQITHKTIIESGKLLFMAMSTIGMSEATEIGFENSKTKTKTSILYLNHICDKNMVEQVINVLNISKKLSY